MAARATENLQAALIRTFTVKAATSAVKGRKCKFGASDTEVEVCGANEAGIGWFNEAKSAGERVQVVMDGYAIVEVIVGTGGATRGALAVTVADGMTDQTAGGGTNAAHTSGRFLNSGVATDKVGLLLGASITTVKA